MYIHYFGLSRRTAVFIPPSAEYLDAEAGRLSWRSGAMKLEGPTQPEANPRPKRRSEAKALQRDVIIDATLDSIAEHGISGTTVSRIVERAGISRGMVNLHFTSKDNLLMEVLRELHRRYTERYATALSESSATPEKRILRYISVELHPEVFNNRNMSAWFAFRGEAKSHPEYLPYIDSRDPELASRLTAVFAEGLGKRRAKLADELANTLIFLIEGLYLDFHLHPEQFDHNYARRICVCFVERAFSKT
jgi:TetR/AcrR family transcriptional regulator, transcriptional repressor of bet genes